MLTKSEVTQSCLTLCDPMDCCSPGFSINGIFQALEWVAISFSRGSSRPRGWTLVSHIISRCFTIWATREVLSISVNMQLIARALNFSTTFLYIKKKFNWKLIALQYCVGFCYILTCCCCSVLQLCLTVCGPMNCSTPGLPVLHYHPECAQTQRSLSQSCQSSPSSPAFNLCQHQGLF